MSLSREGDIGEGRVNYLARATAVAGREGQGGQELASLKGAEMAPCLSYAPPCSLAS